LTLSNRQQTTSYDQSQQTTPTVPQACRANQTRGRDLKEPDTRLEARHEAGPGARHEACARWTITKTVWKDLALLRLSWILRGQSLKDIRLRNHRHQNRTTTVQTPEQFDQSIDQIRPKPISARCRYQIKSRPPREVHTPDAKCSNAQPANNARFELHQSIESKKTREEYRNNLF
jgi:hypothetical protein